MGFNQFATVKGKTDAKGTYKYEINLPEVLVGQPLFKGNTNITLEVEVKDQAQHIEEKTHYVLVAKEPISIEILPESGSLVKGVPNNIYILTTSPDGSPLICNLTINTSENGKERVKTDKDGQATIEVTPKTLAL